MAKTFQSEFSEFMDTAAKDDGPISPRDKYVAEGAFKAGAAAVLSLLVVDGVPLERLQVQVLEMRAEVARG